MRNEGPVAEIPTTIDAALGGRLMIEQPAKGYRFAIDPFILAACCSPKAGERVLELGTGVGTALLALLQRHPDIETEGIDKVPDLVRLAIRNAKRNGLQDRVAFALGDVRNWRQSLTPASFDWVIANPPYLPRAAMTLSQDSIKAASNAEDDGGIEAWIDAASGALQPGGRILFIHRADRLADLLAKMNGAFGGFILLPIHPIASAPARRLIVLGRKGMRRPLTILPGFVLHEEAGGWSEKARAILEEATGIDLEEKAAAKSSSEK